VGPSSILLGVIAPLPAEDARSPMLSSEILLSRRSSSVVDMKAVWDVSTMCYGARGQQESRSIIDAGGARLGGSTCTFLARDGDVKLCGDGWKVHRVGMTG
jgi:hypothetical protein